MREKILFIFIFCSLIESKLLAQKQTEKGDRCFVGSTLFMLANLTNDPEPPHYFQINFGYRMTSRDVILIEMITWNYYEPLGVPWSKKATAPNYPGKVKAYGAGLAYKRFLWKRGYLQLHSTLLRQHYKDKNEKILEKGYQLFNTVRLGYQFRFFANRFFIEPSVAMTFWPLNTNLPQSFRAEENKWSSYFFGEPGLHFGFNF